MWHYRRNPVTWITKAYYRLLNCVPTYRDALNICLVIGGLRTATFVTPDLAGNKLNFPDYDTIHREIMDICKGKKQIRVTGMADHRGHKCPLIYLPEVGALVDEWDGDLNNSKLFGQILGYYCAGDIDLKDKFFHSIITLNPETDNVNPFISQACREVSEDTIAHFTQWGMEIKDFLESNEITDKIGFDIQDKKGNEIYSEWF